MVQCRLLPGLESEETSMKEYDDLDKLIEDLDKERDEFKPIWLIWALIGSWVIIGGIIWLGFVVWSALQ